MNIDTIYYDKDWKNAGHKSFATFYRITLEHGRLDIPNRYRDFLINGTLYAEGEYITNDSLNANNTIYNGTCFIYHKNGNISSKTEYTNNGKNKVISIFNESGIILKKERYEDGTLSGHCIYFNDDGTLRQELEYTNGVLNGTQIEYIGDSVKTITQIRNGKLHGKHQYLRNEIIEYEVDFFNNIQHGKEVIYDKEGNIIYSAIYDNGLLMEEYEDGNVKNFKELIDFAPQNTFRLSYRTFNRILSAPDEVEKHLKWYISFADFTLNIFNETENDLKLNINDIKVSCFIDIEGQIVEHDINLYVDAEKVKFLYEEIAQARVNVDASLARRSAIHAATYTTTTTANSSKVYYGNQKTYQKNYSDRNQDITIDYGEQTSSYVDNRYKDQLLKENHEDIVRLREEGKQMVANETKNLYFGEMGIMSKECKTVEFISYNELTEQFTKIFKQGIPKQLKFSCVINGVPIELLSDIKIEYLANKDIKIRNKWAKDSQRKHLLGNFDDRTQLEAENLHIKLCLWEIYAQWQEDLFNYYSK
mgnify:CR=1 FL=1